MDVNVQFIKNRLIGEGAKIHEYFSNLPESVWDKPIYENSGIWSVKSIFAHLVSSEKEFLILFKDIKLGKAGVEENFDIDKFNNDQEIVNKKVPYSDLLNDFLAIRENMVSFVNSLSDDDLLKTGRHPFLGQSTLAEMLKLIYRHDQLHLHDIKKMIKN